MSLSLKRFLAMALGVLTGLNLVACGGNLGGTSATAPETTETLPKKEKTSLKVLTIGHSLAVDAGYMLSLVAAAEGYTELTVGLLIFLKADFNEPFPEPSVSLVVMLKLGKLVSCPLI